MTNSPRIVPLCAMAPLLDSPDLLPAIARAFVAYSRGEAVVPPVGELLFDEPRGDVHIKYGTIKGTPTFVVKVASSFYENPLHGLPSSSGLMLVFASQTGVLQAVLLDEGHLTNVRTAVAGALAAKALANPNPERIGIIGTGEQARLQLRHLANIVPTRRALVWGRRTAAAERYRAAMRAEGFDVDVAPSLDALAGACELIVTTTPSTEALLEARHLRPGHHITAVGADTPEKRELATGLLAAADLVVCDSRGQCAERGDCKGLDTAGFPEFGEILAGTRAGRTSSKQVTVADLTGVAVQDVAMADFVLAHL